MLVPTNAVREVAFHIQLFDVGVFSIPFFKKFSHTGNKTTVALRCQQSRRLEGFLAYPQH